MSLNIKECRLSFNFVVPEPIPSNDLLTLLQKGGFKEIKDIPRRIGTEAIGIERINIARKGGCEILYDSSNGMLGVVGKNINEVLDRFKEVESILTENLEFDLSSSLVKSFELSLDSNLFAKGTSRPLEEISRFLGEDKFSKFNAIIGRDVAPFSIRFYPKSEMKAFNNLRKISEWFDFHIYPYIANPQYYGIKAVFRDNDISTIKGVASKIESMILSIIETIRGG